MNRHFMRENWFMSIMPLIGPVKSTFFVIMLTWYGLLSFRDKLENQVILDPQES